MALSKRVILDQIEITASGIIQVRYRKEVVEDGNVLSFEYHRTSLRPGDSWPDLAASVDGDLIRRGWTAQDIAGRARVNAVVNLEHTPAVIAAFRARQAERLGLER